MLMYKCDVLMEYGVDANFGVVDAKSNLLTLLTLSTQ